MDTLIRIKIKKYKFNSHDVLEEVVFESASSNNIILNENMFAFKEYDKVEICFESTVPNSILKVESFSDENIVELTNGQSVYLSPGGDSDKMFPPGYYSLELIVNSKTYKGLYSIQPNSIAYESLLNIKETLNEICKGLSTDIYYERSTYDFIESDNLNLNLLAFNYLEANAKEITFNLSSILKKPIENLEKQYIVKPSSKRPDSKSVRWKNTSKGISHNSNLYKEKHCALSYDNRENMLLKAICERLVFSISYIEKKIKCHLNYLNIKKNELDNKLNALKQLQLKLSYMNNVQRRKSEVLQDISISEKELEKFNTKLNKLNLSIKNINHSKNALLIFLEQDWVKDIKAANTIKPTSKFMKRFDYSFFYKVYLNICEKNTKKQLSTSFSSKKTSLLYEIYSFISTIKVFEDCGFTWVEGWLKSHDDISTFNGDLENGEKVILKKQNLSVELTYDYTIPRASEVKGSSISQIVASNSNRRKPDMLISIYKDNLFLKSMIIEVKYRKEAYIYNKNGETDVIHQLKEYRNLDFYDGHKCKVSDKRPIQKVVVVYPDCKEKVFKEDIYGFTFISLMPNENNEVVGYDNLYNEVDEFLNS